jgi:hypothetical protein
VTLPFDLRALWERTLQWYHAYSDRDRRVILGILIAAGLSLVYLGVVEPVLDYRKSVGKEIADGQEALERSMRFLGAKDTLRVEREDLRKRLATAKARLLPGGTATLGAAALQERANALASEKGVAVQSTQMMKEEAADPFRKVAVRMTLSGELGPLAELVSGLEYGQQLNIPFIEVSRRGAVAGAKGPRTLAITIEVSGFVQGGTSPKGESSDTEGSPTVEAQADAGQGPDGAGSTTTVAPADDSAATTSTTPVAAAGGAPPTTIVPGVAVPQTTLPPMAVPPPGAPPAVPATAPVPIPGAAPSTVVPSTVVPPAALPPAPSPASPSGGNDAPPPSDVEEGKD